MRGEVMENGCYGIDTEGIGLEEAQTSGNGGTNLRWDPACVRICYHCGLKSIFSCVHTGRCAREALV